MPFSHKIRVGVLRGGPSPEYDVSLKTGGTILANLPEEYEPIDIFISKEGAWHTSGLQKNPYDILKTVDVVVNALHGSYGEDGTVQNLLENLNIPYTGSGSLSSAFGMNKIMSKDIFSRSGLKTPHHIVIQKDEDENNLVSKINQNLPFPIIIKPINSGSSLGVSFVDNVKQVKAALKKSFMHSPKLMVEEFINGKETTCGVIDGFRGKDFYTLLPVEIVKQKDKRFHDYNSKYIDLESRYKIPGNFSESEKRRIGEAAVLIHQNLGLRHYSRSDFIVHPKRGLFVLEVNTLPELTHHSSFIKSLEAVGGNIKEFLSHLLSQTLNNMI
jgi:D-alanine-D-alanine ligase